jgi:hypothetical protein
MKVEQPLLADHTDMRVVAVDDSASPDDRNRIVNLVMTIPAFVILLIALAEIALQKSPSLIDPGSRYPTRLTRLRSMKFGALCGTRCSRPTRSMLARNTAPAFGSCR